MLTEEVADHATVPAKTTRPRPRRARRRLGRANFVLIPAKKSTAAKRRECVDPRREGADVDLGLGVDQARGFRRLDAKGRPASGCLRLLAVPAAGLVAAPRRAHRREREQHDGMTSRRASTLPRRPLTGSRAGLRRRAGSARLRAESAESVVGQSQRALHRARLEAARRSGTAGREHGEGATATP